MLYMYLSVHALKGKQLELLLHLYYNHFMALGLPGWASTRRNIHPLTPIV